MKQPTFEEQLKNAVREVTLSHEDKELMRERLVAYMEISPLASSTTRIASTRGFKTLPIFAYFKSHHLSGALAIALMATASTFGVTSAADGSLPGDLLYPVKVNINEEIKTVLLSGDEAELAWERERTELRLKEASLLAAEGRFDSKRQEEVSKLLAEHTQAVAEKVHAVEAVDPVLAAEVTTELEATLGAHEAVLARLIVEQDESGSAQGSGREFVEQVRTAAIEAGKMRENAEQILAAEAAADEVVTTAAVSIEEEGVEGEAQPTDAVGSIDAVVTVELDKTNSANMRERATYRAAERAQNEYKTTRELLEKLDEESELAVQARAQLASGEALLAEGAVMLNADDLSGAYAAYRKASSIFVKISLLLEAMNLFSVDILHETVVQELPKADDAERVTGEQEEYALADDVEALLAERTAIEARLSASRTLLLSHEGYEEGAVTSGNSFIKDAMAHVLRAEIALVLGDIDDARRLLGVARKQAERAHNILESAAKNPMVQTVPTPAVPEGGQGDQSDEQSFTLTHRYENGTHAWQGVVTLPHACAMLETGAAVAESYPEQITLTLTSSTTEEGSCEEGAVERSFEIRAGASPEAMVRSVIMNGVSRAFTVVE